MQDFIQKVNFKGGIAQFTGTGSPEGVVTAYVGNNYLDTSNGNYYEKASGDNTNTGWTLINGAGGGSITVEDNLTSTSTTNALSANQGRILNEKNNLVYNYYFDGTSTQILHTSQYMDFRWDGSNKQFQYFPKYPTAAWHDAGIVMAKGGSIFISTDDISASQNSWFYFTINGALNTNFNFGNFANLAQMHVTPEVYNSSNPVYRLVAGNGNTNSVWVNIYEIN